MSFCQVPGLKKSVRSIADYSVQQQTLKLLQNRLIMCRIPPEAFTWGGERDQSQEREEVEQTIKGIDGPKERRISTFGRGFWKEHRGSIQRNTESSPKSG